MPYQRPIPDSSPDDKKSSQSSLVGALVQAEKAIQIILVPPCAAFICWLIGSWLDKELHQTWLAMAGVIFGIFAGLFGAVKLTFAITGSQNSAGSKSEGEDKQ
jgi:ABC-type Fe3+-siderophore transport system permease subunit